MNLAAEFIDNPFVGPFRKVEEGIRRQQDLETTLVKEILAKLPQFVGALPQQKDLPAKFAQDGIDLANALNNAAVASVPPVKHTIKIEAVH